MIGVRREYCVRKKCTTHEKLIVLISYVQTVWKYILNDMAGYVFLFYYDI